MAGKLALVWWRFRIKAIHIFKMWRGGVQPLAVDNEMPVIADLHMVARQYRQPLDVKFILRHLVYSKRIQIRDSFGFEDDDFAASGLAKIVGDPVHEQMITRVDLEFHHVVALVIRISWEQAGARHEALLAIIRREPDRVLDAADHKRLPDVENQKAFRRIDGLQFTVILRNDVN